MIGLFSWLKGSNSPGDFHAQASDFPPVLISCHIGKTGGTSIRAMLQEVFGANEVAFLTRPPGSGPIARTLYNFLPYLYGNKRAVDSHDLRYVDPDEFWPKARFITVLRDPVEAFFSGYYFVRHNVGLRLVDVTHDEREDWLVKNYPSLEDMAGVFENNMTRFLSWKSFYEKATEDDLERALIELPKYDIVALNERMAETPRLIARFYPEFASATVPRLNAAPGRAATEKWANKMPPKQVEWARDLLRLDLRLYDAACELFEARLSES